MNPQISSATNRMPHAIATRMSHIWYFEVSCWPPWTVGKRVTARFFVKDLGLALAPKMCPDQSQAFKEVNNSQAFTVGRKKMTNFFFGRAASRCSKACLHKVSRQWSKNWLRTRRTNIKSNLTPEIEYPRKTNNYDAKPWFLLFTAQKSKCPRRFWEIDPEIWHTCLLMCPCRAFHEWIFLLFVFFAGNVTLDPNIPKKYENPNIYRKIIKKKS